MRFHTQTAGSTLTAQQPLNNVVRTTVQALAAVLGGTQSLHTNAFDEALGLPTEASATVALRTQQILANESGVTNTVDPLAGSFFVEALTDALESAAWEIISQIDEAGGALAAVEQGLQKGQIERSAYEASLRLESGSDVVIGVNAYVVDEPEPLVGGTVDPQLEKDQVAALRQYRSTRSGQAVADRLAELVSVASGPGNVVPPIRDAFAAGATLGEISDALRSVFGTYAE